MAELKETITDLFVQLNPHNQAGFLQKMRDFDVYSKIDLSEDEFVSMTNRKKLKLKITKLFSQLNPKHQQGFLDQMQAMSSSPSSSSSSSLSSHKKRLSEHHLLIGPKRQRLTVAGAMKVTGGGNDDYVDEEYDDVDATGDVDEEYDDDDDDDEDRIQNILGEGDENVLLQFYEDETNTLFEPDIIFQDLLKVLGSEAQMFRGRNAKLQHFVKNLLELAADIDTDNKQNFSVYGPIDKDMKPILSTILTQVKRRINVKWIAPVTSQILNTDDLAKVGTERFQSMKTGDKAYFHEMFYKNTKQALTKGVVDDGASVYIDSYLVAPSYFKSATGGAQVVPRKNITQLIPTLEGLLSSKDARPFLQNSFGLGLTHLKKMAHKLLLFKDYEVSAAHKKVYLELCDHAEKAKRLRQAVSKEKADLQTAEAAAAAADDTTEAETEAEAEAADLNINAKETLYQQLQETGPNPFGSLTTVEPYLLNDLFENYKGVYHKLVEDFGGALVAYKKSLAAAAAAAAAAAKVGKPTTSMVVSTGSSMLYGQRTRFEHLQDKLDAIFYMPIVFQRQQLDKFLEEHTFKGGEWYIEKTSNQNILCLHRYNQACSLGIDNLIEYKGDNGDEKVCRICHESLGGNDLKFASLVQEEDGTTKDFSGEVGQHANGQILLGTGAPLVLSLTVSVYHEKDTPQHQMEVALNQQLNNLPEYARYKKQFLTDQKAKKDFIDLCVQEDIKPKRKKEFMAFIREKLPPPPSTGGESCVVPLDQSKIVCIEKKTQNSGPLSAAAAASTTTSPLIQDLMERKLNLRKIPEQYTKALKIPRLATEFLRHHNKLRSTQELEKLSETPEFGYMFKDITHEKINMDIGTKFIIKPTRQPSLISAFSKTEEEELPVLTQKKTLDDYVVDDDKNPVNKLLVLFVHNVTKKMVEENKMMTDVFDQCSKIGSTENAIEAAQEDDDNSSSTPDNSAEVLDDGNLNDD